jgi:tryptophan synthase alpha chain
MNRLDTLFKEKQKNILSIYFTAGHPKLESTVDIIKTLASEGVDMIEIGIPFSDPIADGPVIQKSCYTALENGMSLKLLFSQIKNIRDEVKIPLIMMGSFNPVLQYGIEGFCLACKETGIDGVIIPDLPLDIYQEDYKQIFEKYNLHAIFLATPQTSDERYRILDEATRGFLYMVAASATTGVREKFEGYQEEYFERIKNLSLKSPRMIGFGISSKKTFDHACRYANGAIIGSAFVNALEQPGDLEKNICNFIRSVRKS